MTQDREKDREFVQQLIENPEKLRSFAQEAGFASFLVNLHASCDEKDNKQLLETLSASSECRVAMLRVIEDYYKSHRASDTLQWPKVFYDIPDLVTKCACEEKWFSRDEASSAFVVELCLNLMRSMQKSDSDIMTRSLSAISMLWTHRPSIPGLSRILQEANLLPALFPILSSEWSEHHSPYAVAYRLMEMISKDELIMDAVHDQAQKFVYACLVNASESHLRQACALIVYLAALSPRTSSAIILTEGFLFEMTEEAQASATVSHAFLRALGAVSSLQSCKEAILQECSVYLKECSLDHSTDPENFVLSMVIYCKCSVINKSSEFQVRSLLWHSSVQQLTVSMEVADAAAEVLMILSTHDDLCETIVSSKYIQTLLLMPKSWLRRIAYSVLVIFQNLIVDHSVTSQTQALRSSMARSPGALGDSSAKDIKALKMTLYETKAMSVLGELLLMRGRTISLVLTQVICSFAEETKCRSELLKIGCLKYLLNPSLTHDNLGVVDQYAAEAVAKLLISTDPVLTFGGSSVSVFVAITMLSTMLSPSQERLLARFEALLALTNLSTMGEAVCEYLIQRLPSIPILLTAEHVLLVRASTELMCNLVRSQSGESLFMPISSQQNENLGLLLSLVESEDLSTSKAALGGMASLSESRPIASVLLADEGTLAVFIRLLLEGDRDIAHRCMVIMTNLLHCFKAENSPSNAALYKSVQSTNLLSRRGDPRKLLAPENDPELSALCTEFEGLLSVFERQ